MRKFKLVFWIFLCAWLVKSVRGAKSGPFKVSYTRVGECPSRTLPLDPDPPSTFFAELYNTSTEINLMRGKNVVLRDHRIKKLHAKSYIWDKNKWKVNYVMNNMGCNHVFFSMLTTLIGHKYEKKTCTSFKGVYVYNNLSVDRCQHLWMKTQEYGRVKWRVEMFSLAGSIYCWEFETLVEPADK